MKQRITLEQIKTLTKEEEQVLISLWKPEMGDWVYDKEMKEEAIVDGIDADGKRVYITWMDGGRGEYPLSTNLVPLLSIGQMLEIMDNIFDLKKEFVQGGTMYIYSISDRELCDVLWEDVKQRINYKVVNK